VNLTKIIPRGLQALSVKYRYAVLGGLVAILPLFLLSGASGGPSGFFDLPKTLPPNEYGNIQFNRKSADAVTFSHWTHRQRFTCRVCHFELEFNMMANTTEMTEEAIRSGRYCGASGCHDGKAAFGHEKPHCPKCHNGNLGYGKEKFSQLSSFPKATSGNRVAWVQALAKGMIAPVNYLTIEPPATSVNIKPLIMEAEWASIPAAIFSHKVHTQWLDCNNCHPDIFNIKKKTTKHFSMDRILKGEFCGVCHLSVAFPMNDCKRCHTNHSSIPE
jgi:c(7)-type cytochrome triheme protein